MFSQKDRQKCEELYDRYYAGRKFYDALYREKIAQHHRPQQRVLDAGCGRYMTFCKDLAPKSAMVVGLDLEPQLETRNRNPPFGVRGDLDHLPFASGTFDLIISRSVVEHLLNPVQVFKEFARVLRPGGKVVVITPNKWDYVSVIAAVTPYRFHRSLVSRIFGVSEDDVFPTAYRANTAAAIRKTFGEAGFADCEIEMVNHYPAYLMFSPVLFRLGVLYERLTSLTALRGLRGSILAVFQKRSMPEGMGV
jgi:SAM-dependent methyltransferase